MRVIALDTTTRSGSVALVEDGRVVDERAGDGARTHAQRLPAEIIALVETHGLSLADVDLYAVASGPGSFTGIRIGIATIQGLAFVQGTPVAGISALEALAQIAGSGRPPGTTVAAMMDAHRHEVFVAVYRVTAAMPFSEQRLVEVEAPTAADAAATIERWRNAFASGVDVCVGDGAVLYADALGRRLPSATVLPGPLLAAGIGRMAVDRRARAVAADGLRALYVRRPDVELERERHASK
jgi:tRNA threonylcarbamoyladenosine biosynthesis protein TsaB